MSAGSILGVALGTALLLLHGAPPALADDLPAVPATEFAAIPGSVQDVATSPAETAPTVAPTQEATGLPETVTIPGTVSEVTDTAPDSANLPVVTTIPETDGQPAAPSQEPSPDTTPLPMASSPSDTNKYGVRAPAVVDGKVRPQGGYTINTSLLAPYAASVTAQELEAAIRAEHPESPLAKLAPVFVREGQANGINPLFIAAHAATESGWGTSKISRATGNLFGMNAFDSNPWAATRYASMEESITKYASYMKDRYLTGGNWRYQGASTHGVFVHYSSSHDHEAKTVTAIMNQLGSSIDQARENSKPSAPDNRATLAPTAPLRKDDATSQIQEAAAQPEQPTPPEPGLDQIPVVEAVPELQDETAPTPAPIIQPETAPTPNQPQAQPQPEVKPAAPKPTSGSRSHVRAGSTVRTMADTVKPKYGYTINVPADDPSSNNMFYYSQNKDDRWSRKPGVFGPGKTIARCGCGPTSLAMIFSTLNGRFISPVEVAKVMKEQNALAWPCGTRGEDGMPAVAAQFGLHAQRAYSNWAKVDDALKNGGMVAVSTHRSPFGGDHYIVIRGITEDGEYLVANPLMGTAEDGRDYSASSFKSWPKSAFHLNHGFLVVTKR